MFRGVLLERLCVVQLICVRLWTTDLCLSVDKLEERKKKTRKESMLVYRGQFMLLIILSSLGDVIKQLTRKNSTDEKLLSLVPFRIESLPCEQDCSLILSLKRSAVLSFSLLTDQTGSSRILPFDRSVFRGLSKRKLTL